jgi:site-specific recombinase XerD
MKTNEALKKFLTSRRSRGLKLSTLSWYKVRLSRFAKLYTKLPLSPEPIETFLETCSNSQETRCADFRALRAFYRFVSKRLSVSNPMEDIAAPRRINKVMPTCESFELMRLLNAATNIRDKTLITLLVDTGARATEISTLRRQDIKTETIHVAGKTGERVVPVSEETRRLLVSLANPEQEYIFMGERGPLTRHGVYRIVRDCMARAGISGPKLGPHRLRHTFGRCYLVAGGDVRSLQKIMGHKSISTTERYAALAQTEIVAKHHKFSPLRAAHTAQEYLFEPGIINIT